eukprot:Blabericola_migrator_1__8600@NODE_4500_length_1119_cov_9_706274_g2759_i1_p1_GENE_NODE_4500_length_1119_cov_9_706274_g2759_i1NODE_4500_length_1119_cov_9_706274_g2759_i1_p1_ORF_typecomplete_len157_score2_25Integrase_H2C2/PF17921_1/1_4e15rve/PF00665_26/2_7e09zfH2C2/PF09337_10/4_3e06_NODE_4500_length_1119_cov_9_706274_g2759_i1463933
MQHVDYKRIGLLLTQDYKQYIPSSLRQRILHAVHHLHHQHYGQRKTAEHILQRYWWPNLRQHVREYITGCEICIQKKYGHERRMGLQKSIQANDAMDLIQMDIIGPLDETKARNRYILTCIDTFSRLAWAIPLHTANSAEISEAFLKEWVLRWGPH